MTCPFTSARLFKIFPVARVVPDHLCVLLRGSLDIDRQARATLDCSFSDFAVFQIFVHSIPASKPHACGRVLALYLQRGDATFACADAMLYQYATDFRFNIIAVIYFQPGSGYGILALGSAQYCVWPLVLDWW